MENLYFLVVNYNSSDLVERLLKSLPDNNLDSYKIIIVNNSTEDKNIHQLTSDRIIIIEAKHNLGFGKACNLGLSWIYQRDERAIVWLINPDAYFELAISPVDTAIAFFRDHPQISILGTTVYNSKGELTAAGGTFIPGKAALSTITSFPENVLEGYLETDWVSGCSLLINLTNFAQCPSFDPRYFLYYEDLDFCLRYSQQRHQIAVTDLLRVRHDTSTITNRNLYQKYRHVTHSYLIHIEKYGSGQVFIKTNLRMLINTLRLLIFKPQQGAGKLVGFYNYWQTRLNSKNV